MKVTTHSGFNVRAASVAAVLGCVLVVGTGAWAGGVVPDAFPANRYALMAAKSPFTPPTAPVAAVVAPTPPPGPSWGDKLTVTSFVQDGGVFKVTVTDPDQAGSIFLQSDREEERLHMQVASVKLPSVRNDQPGVRETPVITIRKGTEFATVRYEPGGGGAGAIGGVPPPGAPGINRTFLPNNQVRPINAPVIPGVNGGMAFTPPPPPAGMVVPATNGARRAPIRSFPQPAAPAAVRPVLPGNTTTNPVRPGIGKVEEDDDDDE